MQSALLTWAGACGGLLCAFGCTPDAPSAGSGASGSAGASGGAGLGSAGDAALGGSSAGMPTSAAGGQGGSAGGNGGAGGSGAANGGAGGGSAGASGGSAGASAGLDCTGRIVCDDFEKAPAAGAKPGAPWQLRESDGSVSYDDTRAVSGKYSVKVAITATAADSSYRRAFLNLSGAPLIPLPGNKVFGRFMIYTDRIPDKTVHWTFAHGDGPYGQNTATYNYGGMGNLMANYYRNSTPTETDCWQTKNENFPTGKWQCVGFMFDGPNNEMRFWMGPSEVSEVHVLGNQKTDQTCTKKGIDGKWYAPDAFKNISIGWESYQHDVAGAHDAWIDDIVLDDEAIACP